MSELGHGDVVSLEVTSHPRNLCLVRTMVRAFAELAGFGGRQLDRIALAVDEACANVIRHAYGGREDGDMTVTCAVEPDEAGRATLVVRLLDHGLPTQAPPLPRAHGSDLLPGGLGLRLMHDIMDLVSFGRAEDGGNLLVLALRCPS